MASSNLNITSLAAAQSEKEATINAAVEALYVALGSFALSVASGNVTLTAAQFRSAIMFSVLGASASGRMLIRDLLEEAACDCREAGDAEQAFSVLNTAGWRPDVLVRDYNLGRGPDGADVAAAAKQRRAGLPIIYATGNPECIADLGPRERVVAKPLAAAELIAAVREIGEGADVSGPSAMQHVGALRTDGALLAA